jgi:hypothetical protein
MGRLRNLGDASSPVQVDLKGMPNLKTPTGPLVTLTTELSACLRIFVGYFRSALGTLSTTAAGNANDFLFVGLKGKQLDTFRRATHTACTLMGVPKASPHQVRPHTSVVELM